MATINQFLPQVVPYAPGCPEAVVLEAIRNACITFCERSLILQETLTPINVTVDISEYAVVPTPTTTKPERVLMAWYNSSRIWPVTPEQVAKQEADPNTAKGTPSHFWQRLKGKINLVPIPIATLATSLRMKIAFTPSLVASTVDDMLLNEFYEDIAAGARARLMWQPEKSYTNPVAAAKEEAVFTSGCGRARILAQKGFTDADLQVQFRRIW